MVAINGIQDKVIDQHYVPRCYMKNFANVSGSARKEKALVAFYQFRSKILRANVPTKSICYKNYFYGEDCIIEKELSQREKVWAQVLKESSQSNAYCLDEEKRGIIKEFAIFQYGRTKAMYEYEKDKIAHILTTNLCIELPDVEKALIHQQVARKVEEDLKPADIVNISRKLVETIEDLQISTIKFHTETKLITSDMPIIVMNPFCPDTAGLACVGCVVLFPISEDTLIVIYDGKIYNLDEYLISDNDDDVYNLNKYQVLSAEGQILAKSQTDLLPYIHDETLMSEREQYHLKEKVLSSNDGLGTLMALKSLKMDYQYNLTFLKIPSYIKKIPKECRCAWSRKYSEKARLNLLVCAYRVPKRLEKDFGLEKGEVATRTKGYLRMQRFMDDYWGLSKDERVITPNLMDKISKVSLKRF